MDQQIGSLSRATASLQLIWLGSEALRLVWSNFSSFAFCCSKITSVYLNSPTECYFQLWLLLDALLLLFRVEAVLVKKQESSIQQTFSLVPILAFVKPNGKQG